MTSSDEIMEGVGSALAHDVTPYLKQIARQLKIANLIKLSTNEHVNQRLKAHYGKLAMQLIEQEDTE